MERLDGLRNFFFSTPTSRVISQSAPKRSGWTGGITAFCSYGHLARKANRNARHDRINRSLASPSERFQGEASCLTLPESLRTHRDSSASEVVKGIAVLQIGHFGGPVFLAVNVQHWIGAESLASKENHENGRQETTLTKRGNSLRLAQPRTRPDTCAEGQTRQASRSGG